jgi:hypothetical protein
MHPQATVPDVVCPDCFTPVPWATIQQPGTDRYGRTLRTYYGWCFRCNKGAEVIQVLSGDRWPIHKFRSYDLIDDAACRTTGEWVILTPLPQPPLVQHGPGGDYDRPFDGESLAVDVLDLLQGFAHKLSSLLAKYKRPA